MKFFSVFSAFIFFAALFCSQIALAETDSAVYAEKGVYKKTLTRWNRASKRLDIKADTWVWSYKKSDYLHKNGARDSLLIVPKASVAEEITLVIWFHGLRGFGDRTFLKRLGPQVKRLSDDGASIALAVPEMPWSVNTRTPSSRQGRVWLEEKSLKTYVLSAKEKLKTWARLRHGQNLGEVRVVVIGHSAGGSAIMASSKEGGLCDINPEHIIWSDATYGSWLARAASGCIKKFDQNVSMSVIVKEGSITHKQAQKSLKKFSTNDNGPNLLYRVLNKRIWTHSKIGDNIFDITGIFPPGC